MAYGIATTAPGTGFLVRASITLMPKSPLWERVLVELLALWSEGVFVEFVGSVMVGEEVLLVLLVVSQPAPVKIIIDARPKKKIFFIFIKVLVCNQSL